MRKFHLPIDLQEEAIELYQQSFDNDEEDSVAIKRIQDLIVEKGLKAPISDKTIYRLINEWKRTGAVRSVIESFDVNLSSPHRRTELILNVLEEELKKSIEANEMISKKLRICDAMHKYIETEIKIEVLRSKKTTVSSGQEKGTARIVMNTDDDIIS